MLTRPVTASITHEYNEKRKRKNKDTGKIEEYLHAGVDYGAKRGSEVKASAGGRVVRASGVHAKFGNLIIIYHGRNRKSGKHTYTLYAHLQGMDVAFGDSVDEGERIGTVGETGNADGAHLHFEAAESSGEIKWHETGATGIPGRRHRINPATFLRYKKDAFKQGLTDEEKKKIREHLFIDLVMDIKNKTWRFDAYLSGKKVGSLDKHTNKISGKITRKELEELMKNPASPPMLARESVEPKKYEITIGGSS